MTVNAAVWRVTVMVLLMTTNWTAGDEMQRTIEDKRIEGVHVRWVRPEIPLRVAAFEPAESRHIPVDGEHVPASDYVPLGIYTGDYGDAVWPFMLDDVKRHYGNVIHINGDSSWPGEWIYPDPEHRSRYYSSSPQGLELLTRMTARAGVRLYFQNGGSPLHWPIREQLGPPREQVLADALEWVEHVLPAYARDPELRRGLLVWGITEEIDEPTARDPRLRQLKEQVEKADPYHPPIVLIMPHTANVQRALVETWGSVPIMLTDHYLNHRGIDRRTVSTFNIQRLKLWSDLAREHDARLWVMPACFSMMSDLRPEGTSGYRILDPREVRMSLWTSVAYGASGLILFKYYDDDSWGRSCLTRFDFKPTEEYVAASRVFRRVKRLAPLVSAWRLDGEVAYDPANNTLAGRFRHPDYKGIFTVVANSHAFADATYKPQDELYELEAFSKVSDAIHLTGGDAAVLFDGDAAEVTQLRQLLGTDLTPMRQAEPELVESQLWRWNDGSVVTESVSAETITFGGKGAIPRIHRPGIETPSRGDLIEWGDGVMIPSAMYYPPYPGIDEAALHLRWDVAGISGDEIDRAVLTLSVRDAVPGGRIAVYPVVEGGMSMEGAGEYMPRWERDFIDLNAGDTLTIEMTGVLSDWAAGRLENRGIIIVYEGYPGEGRQVRLADAPLLRVRHISDDRASDE